MTYPKALSFLNSFINYEWLNCYPYRSSFRLERVQRLLQFLDNPHRALRAIHIAGTKGKGSTCAFVAHILKEAGFKVGLYTSPHLVELRERIRILQRTENPPTPSLPPTPWLRRTSRRASREQRTEQGEIARKDFARLIEKIRPYAEKLRKTKLGSISYFEILTALTFLYFKEKKCDFVVLETGIGGRLDATNVACASVCAITPISYEHTQVLGTTLKEIATEKAGIIKDRNQKPEYPTTPRLRRAGRNQKTKDRSQVVVTAPQRPIALKVIRRQAKKLGADLYEVGKDIQIKERTSSVKGQSFDVKGVFGEYPGLKIGLLGRHQIVNTAVAIGCVESLRAQGVEVGQKAIRKGLRKTQWLARLQIISRRPKVILDAAHCRASSRALKETLSKFFKFRKVILVFGVSQDKDVRGILKELLPLSSRIILTKTENPRAMEPAIVKTFLKANAKPVILTEDPTQALKIARQSAGQKDLILVSGSLYLLGEILKKSKKLFNADIRPSFSLKD